MDFAVRREERTTHWEKFIKYPGVFLLLELLRESSEGN
jgi:hypothetical protein